MCKIFSDCTPGGLEISSGHTLTLKQAFRTVSMIQEI